MIRLSRRISLIWSTVSLFSILCLGRLFLVQPQMTQYENLLRLLAALSLPLAGSLCFGAWLYFRSRSRRPGREQHGFSFFATHRHSISVSLFFLAQVIAFGLITSTWLNLRHLPPFPLSKYVLVLWIALAYSAPFALFLIASGENYAARLAKLDPEHIRNGLLLLASILAAALIGLSAAGLYVTLLDSQTSPFSNINTYLTGIGIPFLILDLTLILSILLPVEKIIPHHAFPSPSLPKRSFLAQPLVSALLISIPYFLIFIFVLHPGYGINDDFGIISLASGYLGGKPVPFLAYSNVLLGFVFNALYALHTSLNWWMLFLLFLDFLATSALLQMVFSMPLGSSQKLLGALGVLICNAYFLINLTYTIIAAYVTTAGLCLLLSAVGSKNCLRSGKLWLGIALAFLGSLIRFESWLLVLVILLPALAVSLRSFKLTDLAVGLALMGLVTLGGFVFNRLYIRSSPAWSAYYTYNQVRSKLHDTPRLANMGATIQAVGWNENDLVMFTHWFFPDPQVYSLEHLEYLAEHVSNLRDIPSTLIYSAHRLVFPGSLPYILMIVSTWLGLLLYFPIKKQVLPLFIIGLDSLGVIFFLAWARKLPDRVLLPLLAAAVLFGWYLLYRGEAGEKSRPPADSGIFFRRLGIVSILLSFAMAVGLVTGQSIQTSQENIIKQTAYRQILSDIRELVASGVIPPDALIASNATGIPLEWSYPFRLELPPVQYLDMGWFTYSPSFEAELRLYGVQSLPAGFYQNSRVFLMTRENMMFGILQFIRDHNDVEASANKIYSMPNQSSDSVYDDVALYKLDLKK